MKVKLCPPDLVSCENPLAFAMAIIMDCAEKWRPKVEYWKRRALKAEAAQSKEE